MGFYRTIDVRMYGDAKFRKLTGPPPCGKYLWQYLLTGPHTGPIPGLFRAGPAAMAEELGWPLEGFLKAFGEVLAQGMAKADFEAKLIWVPNAVRYNKPASPNVVVNWTKYLDMFPECPLRDEAFQALKAYLKGLGEAFWKPFAKAMPNQEQEQEQEQEKDIRGNVAGERGDVVTSAAQVPPADADGVQSSLQLTVGPKTARDDVGEVWSHYRTYHPKARKVLASDRKEAKLIRARLTEYPVEDLKAAIDGYHKSPFHNGSETGRQYLGLDLILRDGMHVLRGIEMSEQPTSGGGGQASRPLDLSLTASDTEH